MFCQKHKSVRLDADEQIGVAVLDQRNLCGPGNLYKAEGLFVCGVHPWIRVADVEDLADDLAVTAPGGGAWGWPCCG